MKIPFADLIGDLANPVRTLFVAMAGLSLSMLMFADRWALAVAVTAAAIILGYLVERIGKGLLPNHPVPALAFMEWWILAPAAVAALGSALLTWLAVRLAPPEGMAAQDQELLKAFAAAMSTFVTAMFVTNGSDRDNTRLAGRIKAAFLDRYRRVKPGDPRVPGVVYLKPSSPAEQALQALNLGWGWDDRHTRVTRLDRALRDGSSRA
jgi:hypothetical protein